MAMQKRIGDKDVRAKLAFIAADPERLTRKQFYTILRNICVWEGERIREGEIHDFLAFVEKGHISHAPEAGTVTNEFQIDGNVAVVTKEIVQSKIKEKLYHQSEAFRKSGQKSTHPPRWLTSNKLVIIVGSTRFLMDNVDLYLEREGLLRADTFELLKEVAELNPNKASRCDNYLAVDVADRRFYRGYLEELGRVAGIRPKEDEDQRFSTAELLQRIGEN